MSTLIIQVKPTQSTDFDVDALTVAFAALAQKYKFVHQHTVEEGEEDVPFLNYFFETSDTVALWEAIWDVMYRSPTFGVHLAYASIAVCTGKHGWDDYAQLYHYDYAGSADVAVH